MDSYRARLHSAGSVEHGNLPAWDAADRKNERGSCLANLFYQHGKAVSRNALATLFLSILLIICCSIGLIRLDVTSNPESIWVPPGSTTMLQQNFFGAAFDPFYRVEQAIFKLKPEAIARRKAQLQAEYGPGLTYTPEEIDLLSSNVLYPEYFQEVLNVQEDVVNATDSVGTTLNDLCFKPIPGEGCIIESPNNYFKSNRTYIERMTVVDIQKQILCAKDANLTGIQCWSAIGVPVMEYVIFGGIAHSDKAPGFQGAKEAAICGRNGTIASALMLTFPLNNMAADWAPAAQWEEEVFLSILGRFQSEDLEVSYLSERSVQDEIKVIAEQNAGVVVVSYLVMFIYITLALGKFPHPVRSRSLLGLSGVLLVATSVTAALGIVSYAGMEITMIVEEVLPFLILAIGVDNMFIIVKARDRRVVEHASRLAAKEDRLEGISIQAGGGGGGRGGLPYVSPAAGTPNQAVLTSLESGGGSGAGAPGRSGDAGFLDEDEDRDDPVVPPAALCQPHTGPDPRWVLEAELKESVEEQIAWTLAEVGPTITAAAVSEVLAFGVGAATRIPALQQFCIVAAIAIAIDYLMQMTWFVASVTLDTERQLQGRADCCFCWQPGRDAFLDTKFWRFVVRGEFVKWGLESLWLPVVLHPISKVVVLMLWVAFFVGSIVGATQLKLGLPQQIAMPVGSEINNYFNDQAAYGDVGPPVYVVLQNVNYSDPVVGDAMLNMSIAMGQQQPAIQPPLVNWYGQFQQWKQSQDKDDFQHYCQHKPLQDEDAPLAVQVFQFSNNISVLGTCCTQRGSCGQQFQSDIKFLWGSLREHPDFPPGQKQDKLEELLLSMDTTLDNAPVAIMSSRMRGQHGPVRQQTDYIDYMRTARAVVEKLSPTFPVLDFDKLWLPNGTNLHGHSAGQAGIWSDNEHHSWLEKVPGGNTAFPYALYYVFYEQYDYIRGVAVQNVLLAVGAVFIALFLVTRGSTALITTVLVLCVTVDLVGWIWVLNPPEEDVVHTNGQPTNWGIDINAVSVVNLVTAVGLAVEFAVHIANAFAVAEGTRQQRAQAALAEMGASVVTGITFTKLVGVLVLAGAPSHLFRLYYFRMYLGIILIGAFHGLAVLPVLLSLVGPASTRPAPDAAARQRQADKDELYGMASVPKSPAALG